MFRFSRILVALSVALALNGTVKGQGGMPSPDLLTESSRITLLTIGPGADLFNTWGHTVVRVHDPSSGIDIGFNYGTFDFDQPGFYVNFVRGRLLYQLSAIPTHYLLREYEATGRPVIEQVLDLDLDERKQFFELLATNYLPENREYYYEFFFDNCSTRPRDLLEQSAGSRLSYAKTGQGGVPFRELLQPGLLNRPWARFGIDLILGMPADEIASDREATFLPFRLLDAFDNGLESGALVAQKDTLSWYGDIYTGRADALPWPAIVLWIVFALALVVTVSELKTSSDIKRPGRLTWFDIVLYVIVGISGLFLLGAWTLTDHLATKKNWNLTWAWPTHLLVPLIGRSVLASKWYHMLVVAIGCALLLGWVFVPQDLSEWLIPLVLTLIVRSLSVVLKTWDSA